MTTSGASQPRRPPAWLAVGFGWLAIVAPSDCAIAGELAPAGLPATRPQLPLTQVSEVKAWSELAGQALPVELEGVVTHAAPGGNFFLHDGAMGIHVGQSESGRFLQPGHRVQVVGTTRRGAFAPSIEPREVRRLGSGMLPAARKASFRDLASGTLDGQWLEMEGVVCEVAVEPGALSLVLILPDEGRRLHAAVLPSSPLEPDSWIDAEVRLRGVASGSFNRQRQLVEPVLRVPGVPFITVMRPPPDDPFAVPLVPLSRLLGFSVEVPSSHRVRIRGVVTRRISDRVFFLREEGFGLKVEARVPCVFATGREIEAVGFPSMTQGAVVLENAIGRVVRIREAPVPIRPPWNKLFEGSHSADLVTVQARVVGRVSAEGAVRLILQAENRVFEAVLPPHGETQAMPEDGSIVDATGIWMISRLEERWSFSPRTFQLLMAGLSDLAVVRPPAWWTPERLWGAVAAMIALLAGGLAWIWSLRRQVQRKRSIIAQQARHAAVLEERSRIARDLHDTLEQGLTGLSLQLKVVEMDHQAAPHQVGESLEAARQMLRRSRALAHDAIRELRTDNPVRRPEPLAASLQRLVDQWRHSGITGIELITEGAARPVAEALERNLAGIAAEAVTNAVKHGRASTIQVRLRFEPEGIQLQVRDNGTGFDPAEKSRSEAGGFGLVGMRERAEAIGGEFLIHSHRGEGTSITVGLKETGRTGDLARLRLDGTAAITASSPAP